uniref:Uncharacterized protein n=1 Tax=viral metagenome TaxID=1070528 RepID=A0A6C0CA75_9ZZZZ
MSSSIDRFVSENKTALMIVGLLIVAFLIYGWWQGNKLNVNVDYSGPVRAPAMMPAMSYTNGYPAQ